MRTGEISAALGLFAIPLINPLPCQPIEWRL
jgi:hypothetical protein